MALPTIGEVFGIAADDTSPAAFSARQTKLSPFRGNQCTKVSKLDPLGICSLADSGQGIVICPVRFIDDGQIFKDAARLSFGTGVRFGVVPEVRILKLEDTKIGKVDYLIARLADGGTVTDFAAVEVQAVYFSGGELRTQFRYFVENNELLPGPGRRPDYRSSAQKRLIPQLTLKVPIFRRWGKKFFVVSDNMFFKSLPNIKSCSEANSEITWLSYPLRLKENRYRFEPAHITFSQWDDVLTALREGVPPEPKEIICELQLRMDAKAGIRLPIMTA